MKTSPQTPLTQSELHVHIGGCFTAEQLFTLGRDIYPAVDWSRLFEHYQAAYGFRPDPTAWFEDALQNGEAGLARFKAQYVYGPEDAGDFGRFIAKFSFLGCLVAHYVQQYPEKVPQLLAQVIENHRQQDALQYVEYRSIYANDDPAGFMAFHRVNASIFQQVSTNNFTARYLISLPRQAAFEAYYLVREFLATYPELQPVVVGVDFSGVEEGFPPKLNCELFRQLAADNAADPASALDVVYHVGESFFDKSLESAVRWCHQAATLGATRLGHAIALGIDPAVAIARRPQAHLSELVSERLDQIEYDLHYQAELRAYGVPVSVAALEAEQAALKQKDPSESLARSYTAARLAAVRARQNFVLDELTRLGTVIEVCPTSNLRIGGIPSPEAHPIHRFLESEVNLVLAADDPGIFDSPLSAEVAWVQQHTGWPLAALEARLGDPYRFRAGRLRRGVSAL